MAPEQGAVGRVRAVNFVLPAMNYLILPADVDDHRRGRRGREIDALPNNGARPFIERHQTLARTPSHRNDHRVPVSHGAWTVTADVEISSEFVPEVVFPDHPPVIFVERMHRALHADCVYQIAGDQRRRIRAGASAQIQPARVGIVREFPHCLAGLGVERDYDFAIAAAVHRIEPSLLNQDRGMALAERTAPQSLRRAGGPILFYALRRYLEITVRPAPLRPGRSRSRGRLRGRFRSRPGLSSLSGD